MAALKKIAFVTYQKAPHLTADDALVLDYLEQFELEAIAAVWNAPAVDWKSFDAVILRSCWDYHRQPEKFRRWIDHLEAARVPVWNPANVVRWNMNKEYLQDLAVRGASIPPTAWIKAGSSLSLHALLQDYGFDQAIIKPVVSATAWQTWRTSLATARDDQPKLDEILRLSGAVVQKFVDAVTANGEWSFIFFAGRYSHAVLKRPQPGDFRVQADFGGTYHAQTPPAQFVKQAEAIVRLIDRPLLYARVDGIEENGRLILIELELIEPQLFLQMDSSAPERFARAIATVVY